LLGQWVYREFMLRELIPNLSCIQNFWRYEP
jgi:hypothetical protein